MIQTKLATYKKL